MGKLSAIKFKNMGDKTITVMLEPWGQEYEVAPGVEITIEGDGPIDHDHLFVHYHEDGPQIWCWEDDMRALCDGKEMELKVR